MKILVTGGTGFIGSHTSVELIEKGYDVIILDNLCNSDASVNSIIDSITNKSHVFYKTDLLDEDGIERVFSENEIDAVIHFAGLKAVGESVQMPLEYYNNNITGTLNLLKVMRAHGCKKLVFSSSATVYGVPKSVPIKEDFPLSTTNPYGSTKLMIERILTDLCAADKEFDVTLLRYFNPVGAHPSGLLGDNPTHPNNLMPRIVDAALGKTEALTVYGTDYPTRDGTGVRDYIHVMDLAHGHIKALEHMGGMKIYNLGTGNGQSVLDLVKSFERVNGVKVPCVNMPRREGDVAECYADASKAERELGWKATRDVDDMCRSTWNFALKSRK
ncbi:MAG: UDP-glucose 4-epimerase GalE [Clostridia bacterium]|nr:UDP-glucose 4-epimerase GalE [Clostridia bacterium]